MRPYSLDRGVDQRLDLRGVRHVSFLRRRLDAWGERDLGRETLATDLNRRHGCIQFGEFGRRETNFARSADVVEHVRHLCCPWDGHNPRLLRHEPREGNPCRRGTFTFSPALHQVNNCQVVRQVFWSEPRLDFANVAICKARIHVDRAGKEAYAERAPRNKTDGRVPDRSE